VGLLSRRRFRMVFVVGFFVAFPFFQKFLSKSKYVLCLSFVDVVLWVFNRDFKDGGDCADVFWHLGLVIIGQQFLQ